MTLEIRPARPADAERLAALSVELGYPMTAAEATERLAPLSAHPDHAILVAAAGGHVDGWIQVSLPRIFETPQRAEIAGLVVDSAARGRGIGRELVAAAADWARERGCAGIRVRTNVVRERAQAFYRREGFRELKKQMVLELELAAPDADLEAPR
jgi:GNAT superfamily N-acetyltransferase